MLVISARSELADKLAGFEHGADDYLTKPFALAEVEARVRALLTRSGTGNVVDPVLRFGTIELDRERGEVRVDGDVVRLTPKAAQLLELLLRKPGQLVRRAAIEDALWPDAPPQADALRSQIHSLRKALAEHGFDGIETVHGVGLRLVAQRRDGALMARRRSLAERVVWAVTGTVALLVGLQSLLAYVAMHDQEDDLSDTMLQREVQQIVAHTTQPGLTPTGMLLDSTRVSAWLTRGGAGDDSLPAPMRTLAPGLYQFAPDGKSLHVAVTDTDDGRLTVVLDATDRGGARPPLRLHDVRALARLRRRDGLDRARRRGDRGRPDRRRDANDRPLGARPAAARRAASDEAGVLTETFNRFRDRVDDMVEREREFAANLDHEIRTPLTTIRTDAELVGLEAALEPAQRRASSGSSPRSTRSSPHRIDAVVQRRPLRRRRGDRSARVPASRRRRDGDRAEAKGLRIVVEVAPGEVIEADRQALLTVVRNIVRNAIEHAAPGDAAHQRRSTRRRLQRRRSGDRSGPPRPALRAPRAADSAVAGAAPGRAFAASAWRSPSGCATCRAGGSRCARRSKAVAARRSRSASRDGADAAPA